MFPITLTQKNIGSKTQRQENEKVLLTFYIF